MFLKTARIRHFRSLDAVEVDFAPITIVVGPNGVGKSNFVDALKFFRDVVRDNLDHAVIGREGIDRIRQTYKSRPYNIGIDFEFSARPRDDEGQAPGFDAGHYEMSLSGKAGEYRVEAERADYWTVDTYLDDDSAGLIEGYSAGRFERRREGELLINGAPYERRVRGDQVALGQSIDLHQLGEPIVQFARGWRFCSLDPNTLRKLSPPTKEDGLSEDGSNWASVVRALKRTKLGRQSLERIAEVMRVTLPGYRDISIETVGSYLVPRITIATTDEEGVRKQREQRFDPVQLSDGTLRIFGILLALYQQPAPTLLVIEEPEQTVHPGVLPALAEACKEASLRTQIVITTHSPHLVDQFNPDQVRIAWMDDGVTRISPIRDTQVESVKRRLMSLQEYMLAEGLLPAQTQQ